MHRPRRAKPHLLISVALIAASCLITLWGGTRWPRTISRAHGVMAALLLVLASLLRLRKKFLRLRVGTVAAWTAAHNWLGGLTLFFALLHARFRMGGTLSGGLLVLLGLLVLSGILGLALQSTLPRLMTDRLPEESPRDDLRPLFAEHWRTVHDIVISVCHEPLDQPERELRAFEIASGIGRCRPLDLRADGPVSSSRSEERALLSRFYRDAVVPFFRAPLSSKGPLSSEAEAALAFDALRGSVDSGLRVSVERIRQICREARLHADEARYRRWLETWVLVHIPLAMMALVLLAAHVLTTLYY